MHAILWAVSYAGYIFFYGIWFKKKNEQAMGIQFGYFTNKYDKLSLPLQEKHLTVLVTSEPMTVF